MLTVVVMLSGPHRMEMLETALDSIPIESPVISELHIRNQGGPWDWGAALRSRWEPHPKVRIIEFPDRVDFAESYNRTLDKVNTPWVVMLPDDDHLIKEPARLAFEALAKQRHVDKYGFAAFGWYYLKDGRYLSTYVKRRDLSGALYYLPKLCSTVLNVKRVRELGGFNGTAGGFNDIVLFSQLAGEFDALLSPIPIGVYRMHEGQESAKMAAVYGPYVKQVTDLIGRYARTEKERKVFERDMAGYTPRNGRAGALVSLLQDVTYRIRSKPALDPDPQSPRVDFRKWSERHWLPYGPY
jgi:hypothetical protein